MRTRLLTTAAAGSLSRLRGFVLMALLLTAPALASANREARLHVGDRVPAIEATTLDGTKVVVRGARQRPVLLLMGFVKDSREDVGKWTGEVQRIWLADSSFDFYEMPMIGSGGWLLSGIISGSMRSGTPAPMQGHVMPLYRDARLWQKRLGLEHPKQAVLVLIDRDGRLVWQGAGPFSETAWKPLQTAIRAVLQAPEH